MKHYEVEKKRKKNKKKGLLMTFVFHSLAIALALFPIMNMQDEPKEQIEAVIVEFDLGSRAEGAKPKMKKDQPAKRTVAKVQPITKQAPKILTSKTPSDLEVPEIKRPVKKVEKVPEPVPSDLPSSSKEVKITPPKVHIPAPSAPAEVETTEESEVMADASESGNGQGETGDGEFENGDKSGEGHGYIEGNGTLSRKVIKYGEIHSMTMESGEVALKICVTREGIVDYVEYDPSKSTISNPELIRGAQQALKEYRFEKDYTAAPRECGVYRFVIDIAE